MDGNRAPVRFRTTSPTTDRLRRADQAGEVQSDASTILAACVMTIGIALAASYLPACRAARIDPVITLRTE